MYHGQPSRLMSAVNEAKRNKPVTCSNKKSHLKRWLFSYHAF